MRWFALLLISIFLATSPNLKGGNWPQFRGPGGKGLPDNDVSLPANIGPEENVVWITNLPPGHSSPVVFENRIYLTAVRDQKLLTLGIDRITGKVLWEAEAPHKKLEKIHRIGNHAQATPVTNGKFVISFFGSSGMLCYDANGKQIWYLPMGPFKNEFGSGSSPIMVGDRVILNQDVDSDSFLLAADIQTGKTIWRTDRSEFPVGYASPIIWETDGKKQIVVSGTLRIVGYDFDTGKEVWTVGGMARVSNMTPSVATDGTLFVAGWAAGADADDRFDVPSFAEMIGKYDSNKNGTLEVEEMPAGPIKQRFAQIDRDKDGHITALEYEGMRHIFQAARNRMVAIKPGGTGDITTSHVLWSLSKQLPYVPSPLVKGRTLFLIKNGGFLCSVDAKTGKILKRDRIPGVSDYYSSPIGGDGKIYLLSQHGNLTVISADPQWQVLATARFGEEIFATPAIVDGRIYLRTSVHLYCFGKP